MLGMRKAMLSSGRPKYPFGGNDEIEREYPSNPIMPGYEPASVMGNGHAEAPAPQKRRGIFGSGVQIQDVLGAFGDAFSGNGPLYAQGKQQRTLLMHQQEQARREEEAKRAAQMEERQYNRQDWEYKQQWERDNPKPYNNDTVNDLNWYKGLSEDDRKLYHQMKPTITFRADGTPMVVNPYDLQQGGQSTPVFAGWPEDDKGGPAPKAQGNFPVSYEQFKRAIIKQESGGRYGVANTEGSGALGLGQIMPDTAKALSSKLGLPYRPDLLAGNSQAARQYQDALTDAAVKEAWQYGGAGKDPRISAQYYFAGPYSHPVRA